MRRPERQHDRAAHGRADQHAEIARGGVEPHRARQVGGAGDVVQQHLVGGLPQHAGAAMDHQQHHGMPHLQGVGDEEIAPPQRGCDEQAHAALDEAARIETVGQRAGSDREQQERQPVGHHGETGQGGGLEFLEHHPVADDVLDIVGHHRQGVGDELGAEAGMAQRGEGSPGRRACSCGLGSVVQGRASGPLSRLRGRVS